VSSNVGTANNNQEKNNETMANLKTRILKLEEAVPDEPWWRKRMLELPRELQNEYIAHGTINGEKMDDGLDEWTEEEMLNYIKTGEQPEGKELR